MNACESVIPAIIENRDPQELGSLLDDPETGPQRLKPDCGAEVSNTDVVLSQAVPERKPRWFPAIWRELGKTRATRKTPHIVHVKVDELFASVEQALNPRLRGKPVLVGRGVVASASCEAKILGVRTGMNLLEARRICPKAILVSGQYKHYADFAERVRRILETYTPTVETAALDDFYLDFAGSQQLYGDFEVTLRRLQAEVLGRTGLNARWWRRLPHNWCGRTASASCHRVQRKCSWLRWRSRSCTPLDTRTEWRWRSKASRRSASSAGFRSRCWWRRLVRKSANRYGNACGESMDASRRGRRRPFRAKPALKAAAPIANFLAACWNT